jgi:hypothetical protein
MIGGERRPVKRAPPGGSPRRSRRLLLARGSTAAANGRGSRSLARGADVAEESRASIERNSPRSRPVSGVIMRHGTGLMLRYGLLVAALMLAGGGPARSAADGLGSMSLAEDVRGGVGPIWRLQRVRADALTIVRDPTGLDRDVWRSRSGRATWPTARAPRSVRNYPKPTTSTSRLAPTSGTASRFTYPWTSPSSTAVSC